MVAVFTTVVDDPDLHPIPGVKVSIKTDDGLLATLFDPVNFAIEIDNPVLSDPYGVVSFAAADDVYFGEYRFAGVLRRVDSIIVGIPPAFVGPSGPANATYLTLAALKASAISNGTALLTAAGNAGLFIWTLGNFTGLADDINVVQANSTPLATGAWVRQKADSLTYRQSGTGAVSRTQADKNADMIDVWDFMTDAMKASVNAGNLSVDTAPAFQSALDYASGKAMNSSGHGRRVTFRGGTYRWATPVTFDWRVAAGVVDAGDLRRPTLEGDGSGNTAIFYTGAAGTPALTISGYSSGANGGVELYLAVKGFWLRRAFASALTGTGIQVKQAAHIMFDDVAVDQFATNFDMIDTIRVHAVDCRITGATTGLFARVDVYAHPNVFLFDRCDFGGNIVNAVKMTTPANIKFESCGFEGNGTGDAAHDVVRINGGPQEGGGGVFFDNCYFENNYGRSDIFLNWSAANNSGTAAITGCTFNRTGTTRAVTNHILVSAETPSVGKLQCNIESNAFKGFGYTPSGTRPVIVQTSASNNAALSFSANYFENAVEMPVLNGWPATGIGYDLLVSRALVANNGTATLPGNRQVNVASVNRTGTGVVDVTLKRPAADNAYILQCGLQTGGTGFAYVQSASTTVITIVTTNAAGTATDLNFWIEIYGNPGV